MFFWYYEPKQTKCQPKQSRSKFNLKRSNSLEDYFEFVLGLPLMFRFSVRPDVDVLSVKSEPDGPDTSSKSGNYHPVNNNIQFWINI
jgi:hypothetical protein